MGSEAKKYEIDMCSGSILKKMLAFTIPLMFSSILQLLFNAAGQQAVLFLNDV